MRGTRRAKTVESSGDRRALAADAGLGPISAVSVLAGALCGYAAMAVLVAIGAAAAVGLNGGNNFANLSDAAVKLGVGLIVAVAAFLAFAYGGYVAGRMSRRGGAANGVAAGLVGVVLGIALVAVIVATGGGDGLARVARHMHIADTWRQWRDTGIEAGVVSAAAMVIGALVGGVKGERWHAKLLARASDAGYGPEAERLAAARKGASEAAAAHDGAAERAERASAAERKAAAERLAAVELATAAERVTVAERARSAVRVDQASAGGRQATADAADTAATATDQPPRRRSLLHR